ncbi:MAG: YifB family Mg chelatase-like AAA ATPase, partial [Lachnospiraceae bacterium]|nr:YifB family Mg chelatase-like AAA ATPase [Lachnospiraceae bacterium]
MYSRIYTATILGIESVSVVVEADVSDGLPVFDMVGFLSSEVREARERVRTSMKNSGCRLPPKRITINLSPAGIRKSGSGFDLPIAVSLMCAMGVLDEKIYRDMVIVGEVSLDGRILPVNGVLPIILGAKKQGIKRCFLPKKNCEESLFVKDMEIYTADSLSDLIDNKIKRIRSESDACNNDLETQVFKDYDFKDMNGQKNVRRACEIAVSGRHNMLMVGPPGSGKSFAAKCIPKILPGMNEQEKLEVAQIYSVGGLYGKRKGLSDERPFRSPHHTVTAKGLTGGGLMPKPGEITLAHKGVLFLDELTEFNQSVLETLREPMEDKTVKLVRAGVNYVFPADFMLVCAMNPCLCGFFPDMNRCSCTRTSINRYLGRLSQPLLDRIDVTVQANRLSYSEIMEKEDNESSLDIRKRVCETVEIQKERYKAEEFNYNSEIPAGRLDDFILLDHKQLAHMKDVYEKYGISVRSYHKILKVARTIADMDNSKDIKMSHLNEAVCYRSID